MEVMGAALCITPGETVREWNLQVGGRPARVWIGGREGRRVLLLLHGGWGGAALHWSPVWGPLSARFRVVAPELPGLSAGSPTGPCDLPGFAAWVEGLLDTLHLPAVWLVGNSFGASLAWQIAATRSGRCAGLVLINGGPPSIPLPARLIFALPGAGLLVEAVTRRLSFSRDTPRRAFADPARVPEELLRLFETRASPQLALMSEVVRRGGVAHETPKMPALIVWGTADHLPGTSVETARQLQRRLPAAQLVLVDSAGHLPQLERPAQVAEAIIRFVDSQP
jgi:2-hydroxy-6-oxonona-2,4-dienedioate hydrolase